VHWLTRNFLSVDPRTLGLTRILIAALLFLDLGKRIPGISLWYTNDGLLPNHRLLWRPLREWMLSYLFALSSKQEVVVAFALTALVYFAFLVGWKTRVAHVLSWFCLLSLQTRVDVLANGGDFVFSTLVLFTMFLPMGRRFSVDAVLDGLRAARGGVSAANEAAPRVLPVQPVVSLAVLALTVQLAVIYFFNAVHKDGATWRDGTAVYWLLHQARIVTVLGVWVREHAPLALLQGLTYGALAVEYALPVLILSPFGRPFTRRAALLLVFGLHGGVALLSNLGVFSPVMMVFSTLLVSADDWDALARRARRPEGPAARVAAVSARVRGAVERGLLALYGGAPWTPADTPARQKLGSARLWLRESCVAFLIVVATSQMLIENRAIPRQLRVSQPRLLRAAVSYLRLNQGWSMFAPEAPRDDMTLVVDAVTADGRHLDPYNEIASAVADPHLRAVPTRLGHDALWCDYTVRIEGHGELHDIFKHWLFDHHKRTGRAEDRIVAVDAYIVQQNSPAPGEPGPHNVRARAFLRQRQSTASRF
jgi:hypothetical protein